MLEKEFLCACSKWISVSWWPVNGSGSSIWIKHGSFFSVCSCASLINSEICKLKPLFIRFCHEAAVRIPWQAPEDFLISTWFLSHGLWLWERQSELMLPQMRTIFAFLPYPVSGWRRDVDDQSPWQLPHLHSEQQGRVGHLLKLLPNELVLRRPLEILGFSYFVHKSQNLLSSLSSPGPAKRRGLEREGEMRLYDANTLMMKVKNLPGDEEPET